MGNQEIHDLFGQIPYFADQVIEACKLIDADASQFVTSCYWSDQASLNLLDVCGTTHPDYAGMTWREFLAKGRRMEGNLLAFRHNPAYYTEALQRLPSMYFHKIDGKTFVAEDGNHRTCIGRFYLYAQESPYIHGVNLVETVVDWHFLALYRRLLTVQPAGWKLSPEKETLRREDGPGWKRDFFQTHLKITDSRNGSTWVWGCDQLAEELFKLEATKGKKAQPSLFRKIFRQRRKEARCR